MFRNITIFPVSNADVHMFLSSHIKMYLFFKEGIETSIGLWNKILRIERYLEIW